MQPSTEPSVIDLVGRYIPHLRDIEHLSPYTIALYTRSLKVCELTTIDLNDLSVTWRYLLDKFENGKVAHTFVDTSVKIVKAAVRLLTRKFSSNNRDYVILVSRLKEYKKEHPTPIETYTNDDIRTITRISWEEKKTTLFPAVILMILAGLRISSCKNVKFNSFRDVQGVPGVKLFEVQSKSSSAYTAAISHHGHWLLQKSNTHSAKYFPDWLYRDDVVAVPPDNKTPFESIMRSRFRYLFVEQHKWFHTRLKDKRMLDGFRGWAKAQMATKLEKKDVALLLGNKSIGSTAIKRHTGRDRDKPIQQLDQRIALAYSKTPLMSWRMAAHYLNDHDKLNFENTGSAA